MADGAAEAAAEKADGDNRDAVVHARLDGAMRETRELWDDIRGFRGELHAIRANLDKNARNDAERGFVIRRIEERMSELFKRLEVVEANHVKKDEFARSFAPIRKWAAWSARFPGALWHGGTRTG